MLTHIKNARICTSDCKGFTQGELFIVDGKIANNPTNFKADVVIDAKNNYIIPGLVDIHTHGAMATGYSSKNNFDAALKFEAGQGVTTVVPTIATQEIDNMILDIQNVSSQMADNNVGSRIAGIHLEGPFLSPAKMGAMPAGAMQCNISNWEKLYNAGKDSIKIMTIAPEVEGALDVITNGNKKGIRMSIGHTNATYEETKKAIDSGAIGATHTFNAMRALNHREPGVLGAVLTEDNVSCEVICDMVHLSEAIIKLIKRIKGIEKMIMISDSDYMAGLGDGVYVAYENAAPRIVKNGVARLEDGTIAASCFTLADGARKLIGAGFSLSDVVIMASLNPAKAIGLDSEIGSIEEGKSADIIICDEKMNVHKVFVRGEEVELSPQIFTLD